MKIRRVGIDLAENVFQSHGADMAVLRKRLSRANLVKFFAQLPPCLLAMEACGSAYRWARTLSALRHEVCLIDARFITPYRKGARTTATAPKPSARRPRDRRCASCRSRARSNRPCFASTAPARCWWNSAPLWSITPAACSPSSASSCQSVGSRCALPELLEDADNALPALAREVFAELYQRLLDLEQRSGEYDQRIDALAKASPAAQRLMQLPGIGPLTATAVLATVCTAHEFHPPRQFAAWLGLTPRQHSSGRSSRLGRITKRGNADLRTLLVHGARSVLRLAAQRTDPTSRWLNALRAPRLQQGRRRPRRQQRAHRVRHAHPRPALSRAQRRTRQRLSASRPRRRHCELVMHGNVGHTERRKTLLRARSQRARLHMRNRCATCHQRPSPYAPHREAG